MYTEYRTPNFYEKSGIGPTGRALLGPDPNRAMKTLDTACGTVHHAPTEPKPKRKQYLRIIHTIETFMADLVTAIEPLTGPHEEHQLTTLLHTMAEDPAVKNRLSLFAAGTGFAKTSNGLITLSQLAIRQCTPALTSAAYGNLPVAEQPTQTLGPSGEDTPTTANRNTPTSRRHAQEEILQMLRGTAKRRKVG